MIPLRRIFIIGLVIVVVVCVVAVSLVVHHHSEYYHHSEYHHNEVKLNYVSSVSPSPVAPQKPLDKSAFFASLTPMITAENQAILKQRHQLEQLSSQTTLTEKQKVFINEISKTYSVPIMDQNVNQDWFNTALRRVNVLPQALVLTQAADESSWGRSRFAQEANNYFGQWCFVDHCGVVPRQRPKDAHYEVAKFASVRDSIHSYFMNLNTSKSYKALRAIREKLSENHQDLESADTALQLIDGLSMYSSRGGSYLNDLRGMVQRYFIGSSNNKPRATLSDKVKNPLYGVCTL